MMSPHFDCKACHYLRSQQAHDPNLLRMALTLTFSSSRLHSEEHDRRQLDIDLYVPVSVLSHQRDDDDCQDKTAGASHSYVHRVPYITYTGTYLLYRTTASIPYIYIRVRPYVCSAVSAIVFYPSTYKKPFILGAVDLLQREEF